MSLLIGGLVALLIVIAGGVTTLGQTSEYTAEAVVVVLPRAELDDSAAASYYDTLSRGQIVGTFAEVASAERFEQQAEDRLSLTDGERGTSRVTVSVVPATSVLSVRAVAEDIDIAERLADETMTLATEYLGSLSEAYRVDVVNSAEDSAFLSSTSPRLLLGLTVVVAPIAGLAVQQAVYHLLTAVGRGRSRRTATTGGTSPTDVSEPGTELYEGSWR